MLLRRRRSVSNRIRMWVSKLLLQSGCTCVHPRLTAQPTTQCPRGAGYDHYCEAALTAHKVTQATHSASHPASTTHVMWTLLSAVQVHWEETKRITDTMSEDIYFAQHFLGILLIPVG